jgi:hypothetical protein
MLEFEKLKTVMNFKYEFSVSFVGNLLNIIIPLAYGLKGQT